MKKTKDLLILGRPINYDEFRRRIAASLSRYGLEREVDDVVQAFFLNLLEGKGVRQVVDHFVVDWLRKTFGKKGSKNYETRVNLYKNFGEFNMYKNFSAYKHNFYNREISHEKFWELIDKCLSEEDKEIAELYFYWGYELKEIGKFFGVGESRMCQRLKSILKDIKAGMGK